MKKEKEICDKCDGKGHWYNYGHSGVGDYYHECEKCHSIGYLIARVEDKKPIRLKEKDLWTIQKFPKVVIEE